MDPNRESRNKFVDLEAIERRATVEYRRWPPPRSCVITAVPGIRWRWKSILPWSETGFFDLGRDETMVVEQPGLSKLCCSVFRRKLLILLLENNDCNCKVRSSLYYSFFILNFSMKKYSNFSNPSAFTFSVSIISKHSQVHTLYYHDFQHKFAFLFYMI